MIARVCCRLLISVRLLSAVGIEGILECFRVCGIAEARADNRTVDAVTERVSTLERGQILNGVGNLQHPRVRLPDRLPKRR